MATAKHKKNKKPKHQHQDTGEVIGRQPARRSIRGRTSHG